MKIRIEKIKNKECQINDLIIMLKNKNKVNIKKSEIKKKGIIPVITQEEKYISGYFDDIKPIDASENNKYIVFGDHSLTKKLINFPFIIGADGTQVFQTKNFINIDYLYFYISQKNFLKSYGYRRHFSLLKEKVVKYPDLKQQEKIASVLSKQERQVEIIETLIEKLEKRNQYYAEKLLSGEKRIRKNDQGEIEFYDNTEWQDVSLNGKIVSIPKGWVVEKLGNKIIEFKKSKIKAGDAKKNKEGIYPFFNCSKKQTLTYDDYIIDDDVLFLNTGGLPAVHYYMGKSSYSTDSWALTTNDDLINKYLYYYILTNIKVLNNFFQGAVIKHLNKKEFKNLEIFYPKLNLQKDIIDYIDKLSKEKDILENLLIKEKLRFQWMLDNLLSGEYQIVD